MPSTNPRKSKRQLLAHFILFNVFYFGSISFWIFGSFIAFGTVGGSLMTAAVVASQIKRSSRMWYMDLMNDIAAVFALRGYESIYSAQ